MKLIANGNKNAYIFSYIILSLLLKFII